MIKQMFAFKLKCCLSVAELRPEEFYRKKLSKLEKMDLEVNNFKMSLTSNLSRLGCGLQ